MERIEPISEQYANGLLQKWTKRLGLEGWTIVLALNCQQDEMPISGTCGCASYEEVGRTARISILNPACYGDRIPPFNFEKTLIHELLHLKFALLHDGDGYESLQYRVLHQCIEDLARAFAECAEEVAIHDEAE